MSEISIRGNHLHAISVPLRLQVKRAAGPSAAQV